MKKLNQNRKHNELRPQYDFASMRGRVRAKHYEDFRKGTNVVLLQPDVAEAFPSEEAVNEALRGIFSTTRAVRRIGGLSDHALQPPAPKRSSRRKRPSFSFRSRSKPQQHDTEFNGFRKEPAFLLLLKTIQHSARPIVLIDKADKSSPY